MQLYVINLMFQRYNFSTIVAQNGHEAYNKVLESLLENNNEQKSDCGNLGLFDLIVLDLNMPISNGWEACIKIIRKYDQDQIFRPQSLNLKPLIIALTSDLIDDLMKRQLHTVGFDMMFEAPITDAHIKNQILPMLQDRFKQKKKQQMR